MAAKMLTLQDFLEMAKELAMPKPERLQWAKQELEEHEKKVLAQRKEEMDHERLMKEEERRIKEEERLIKEKDIQLAQAQKEAANAQQKSAGFDKYKQMSKMANFQESKDNIDSYLMRFEELAKASGLPEEQYSRTLMSLLTGKAIDICIQLPAHELDNYNNVKEALLRQYGATQDAYRKKFYTERPRQEDDPLIFVSNMTMWFDRRISLSKIENSYENLKEHVIIDAITHAHSEDIQSFIIERQPKDIQTLTPIVRQYRAAYPNKPIQQSAEENFICYTKETRTPRFSRPEKTPICTNCNFKGHYASQCKTRDIECSYCHLKGHYANECRKKQNNSSDRSKEKQASRYQPQSTRNQNYGNQNKFYNRKPRSDHTTMTIVTKSKGLEYYPGLVGNQKVEVIRDTGSTSVVVHSKFVKTHQYTGKYVAATAFNGTVSNLPIAEINITTPFYSGDVEALVTDNLPVNLLIGNIKGVRDCTQRDLQDWSKAIKVSQECNAVITRSMTKEQVESYNLQNESNSNQQNDNATKETTDQETTNQNEMTSNSNIPPEFNNEEFKEQKKDPTLSRLYKKALTKINPESNNEPYLDNGMLMKRSKNKHEIIEQIVVPQTYRKTIIESGHSKPFSGHMAVSRTKKRILQHFYWPSITKDVKKYVSTCHICQMKGPKGRHTQAPLQTVELTDKPFQKVAIDIIGPIPIESARKHKYILTLVDTCTRWPEAIPLVNITAIDITRALSEIFSRTGLPEVILSDRGGQFTAEITKAFMDMYKIRMKFTTAYHPQSNGLCERMNSSLKQIISKIANDNPQNWDLLIPAALFAYRESQQETTGFSPFEMLYGANPRGPMAALKESLMAPRQNATATKTAFQHVIDTRNMVIQACQKAKQETAKANIATQRRVNESRTLRKLEPGDKVRLLLPDKKNKFFIQWQGPFLVTKKVTDVDYEIEINNKKKVYHINMLHKYNEEMQENGTVQDTITCLTILQESDSNDTQDLILPNPIPTQTESWKDIKLNNLSCQRKQEVSEILKNYSAIFTDVPGKTSVIEHEINLTSDKPTKQRPYPVPIHYRDFLQKEINQLLQQGIIEHSNSPYAAPIVLVKRHNATTPRMCVDFRQLNKITCLDSYPMPNPEDLMTQFAEAKFFTKIDLSRGYYQIPMKEQCKPYTAFTTAFGLFQFNYMPFGLVNASSTFNRAIHRLF
ncbi:uncharacterized protein LOC129924313 [Biomphalaria glabrata]|uniref:Uncharacterized protein LOC129924313 n=1 Tax=Biomphalaria glabrata TaxID=6526 RepID=A0A9W2ZHP0_BIOGL|nr:uncharacterized protein LOC129924313 [Biomphalaria glabrata]